MTTLDYISSLLTYKSIVLIEMKSIVVYR